MVAFAVVIVSMVVVMGRREQSLPSVVIGGVGENTVLDVATEYALLCKRHGVLDCIVPPAVHAAEEKRAVRLLAHVLVQVELEEFLGAGVLHSCTGESNSIYY